MKAFYILLFSLLCLSCTNKGKEKAELLYKELETVPITSFVFDSLLQEVYMLPSYLQVPILSRISTRDEDTLNVIEKQKEILIRALSFATKKERKQILFQLIVIYQKLDQKEVQNAALEGIGRCDDLLNNYILSRNETWNIKKQKVLFFNNRKSSKEGLSILYELLKEHRELDETLHIIKDLREIASFFFRIGDYAKALTIYKEAYQLSVDNQLLESRNSCMVSIIQILCNLKLYCEIVDINNIEKIDEIAENTPLIYPILSIAYLNQGQSVKAREYLTKMSKKMREGTGFIFYCRMAETYIGEEKADSAAVFLNKAISQVGRIKKKKLLERRELPLYFMYVYPSYASLLQKNGKVEQASEAFQFVEPLMRIPVSEPERMEKQIDALGRYSDFCRSTKRYAEAAELLVYRDSIQKLYYENKISLDSKHWVDRFEIQELTYTTDKQRDEINNTKRMLAIIISASVIVLCISAIAFYLYVKYRKQNKELRELKMQEIQAVQLANSQTNLPKKREPLTPQEKLYNAAKKLVESQKLFLNDALTLDELAEKLDTNRSTLSACINQCSKSNFNQWINNYRIDFIQKRITATSNSRELYTGSGFKSYNTFNNSFKERLGCTPSEYIKEHKYDNLPEDENPIA